MFLCQDCPLLRDGNVRIYFGDVDGAVAEHFLNVADIDICLQQTGRKGVAEHVRCDMHVNGSQGAIVVDHTTNGLIGQRTPRWIDKEMIALLDLREKCMVVAL